MDSALREKSEICALLNEFMYMGFRDAAEGDTIRDVIETIEANRDLYQKYCDKEEFDILKANLDRIGEYEIGSQSWNLTDFNSGTQACTFRCV